MTVEQSKPRSAWVIGAIELGCAALACAIGAQLGGPGFGLLGLCVGATVGTVLAEPRRRPEDGGQ